MNRNQIIVITVLGIATLMLGCKPNAKRVRVEVAGDHRELTAEEKKLVGTYERKRGANTFRFVFLDNGLMAHYSNGEKDSKDLEDVKELQVELGVPNRKVYLMPEGIEPKQLNERRKWLMGLCTKEGYNFTDRLHIIAYGNVRGV